MWHIQFVRSSGKSTISNKIDLPANHTASRPFGLTISGFRRVLLFDDSPLGLLDIQLRVGESTLFCKKMRPFCIIAIIALLPGCKSGRFNWYDRLTVKPTTAELVGTYTLQKSDPDAYPLIEMGYTDIDCSIELRSDGTFTASKLPGCCLHGWDERAYPFTGGLYSMTGDWAIVKTDAVYDVELAVSTMTEHTGLVISDPDLAKEREPSTTLNVALIDGSPIDLGFQVFDGDFWSIRLARSAPPKEMQNKSDMATPNQPSE